MCSRPGKEPVVFRGMPLIKTVPALSRPHNIRPDVLGLPDVGSKLARLANRANVKNTRLGDPTRLQRLP
jgi:hypothetical protein